jgi:putative SbcD/Mre11-related phosphoesterase
MEPTYDDRAVVLGETLVLADLHVGKGSSNLELPIGDSTDTLERLDGLLARHDPAEVVIAGDLLHSFSTVPHSVSTTVEGIRQRCRDHGARPVVTPGNHDTMLDSVWDGPTTPEYAVGDTVVCHGHEAPETDAERYVVGHDHPTIEIEGQRRPCYLVAADAYEGADVVMLPAFNRLLAGVRVNEMRAGEFMSPLIQRVDQFEPIVWDEGRGECLEFPPLGEFRRML